MDERWKKYIDHQLVYELQKIQDGANGHRVGTCLCLYYTKLAQWFRNSERTNEELEKINKTYRVELYLIKKDKLQRTKTHIRLKS